MKPLPDITNEAAMLLRGKRSALAAARSEALIELRDAYTLLDAADWGDMPLQLSRLAAATAQLEHVARMWREVNQGAQVPAPARTGASVAGAPSPSLPTEPAPARNVGAEPETTA